MERPEAPADVEAAVQDDDAARAKKRRARTRMLLLLLPITISSVCIAVGIAMAPVLLERAPLLLIALAPLPRHLVLVSPMAATVPFFAVAVTRSFIVDPFMFRLGRDYGYEALRQFTVRAGVGVGLLRFVLRIFERAGPLVLFVTPDPLMSLLAGATGMRLWVFLALNLGGTFASLTLTRLVGARFAEPLALVRAFVQAHVLETTIVSVVIVGLMVARHIVKERRAERLMAEDDAKH